MTTTHRADIDGLRAIAVLSVIIFHAFPTVLKGGFIGVDIFFVISGFLISRIIISDLKADQFSFVDFYCRRINRIFPALILVLISSFIAGWFLLSSDDYRALCKHIFGGAVFISNFLLWQESGYFDAASELKPLLHLWSLGVEEQFYLVWPFLLSAAWFFGKRRGILGAVCLLAATSFLFSLGLAGTDQAFYSPLCRFWELFLGGLVAVLWREDQKPQHGLSVCGLLLILMGVLLINRQYAFPGMWALLPTVGAVLLIAAGRDAWVNKKILSARPLVLIGLISYPLYLWHWPLLSFYGIHHNVEVTVFFKVGLIGAAFLLAALTYFFIENPSRSKKYKKTKSIVFLILMFFVGCLGLYSFKTDWTDVRLPIEIKAQKNHDFYFKEWKIETRFNACDLPNRRDGKRSDECYEKQRPLIAVWGDSNAASLYMGLKKYQLGRGFGLAQLTHSLCPPILNFLNEKYKNNCIEMNFHDLKVIENLKPDVIILHASWALTGFDFVNQDLPTKLSNTVSAVRAKVPGVRIIVIGPIPMWKGSPEQVIYQYWLKHRSELSPLKQKAILDNAMEHQLKEISFKKNVEYISAYEALCDGEECYAKVPNGADNAYIVYDYGHFTRVGAEFFVSKIIDRIWLNQKDRKNISN